MVTRDCNGTVPVPGSGRPAGKRCGGTSAQGETALDQALNGEEGLLSFTTSEDHPWTVMQDQAETRTYAVSGNSGFAGTTSKVMTRVRVEAGATVSFDWDISGTIFEHLYFYVDNQYTASCDNEARGPWNGWTRYTHTFETGGVHQLEWRYVNSDAPGAQTWAPWTTWW